METLLFSPTAGRLPTLESVTPALRRARPCLRPALQMSKALSSKGQSTSWNAQQKNVVRIFDLTAEQDEELALLEEHTQVAHAAGADAVRSACLRALCILPSVHVRA